LDRFSHLKVKIINFLSNNKADPTDDVGSAAAAVAFDKEDILPWAPMGINTKKNFASSNKNREMEDGVRRQLPELNTV
jgi:hypothetical protein